MLRVSEIRECDWHISPQYELSMVDFGVASHGLFFINVTLPNVRTLYLRPIDNSKSLNENLQLHLGQLSMLSSGLHVRG